MEAVLPYLFIGGVIVALVGWWWHFHFWSTSPAARRARSPISLGFSATATSALFLITGLIGFNLSKRSRFLSDSAWTGDVIWWQVAVGLALVPVAIFFLRRGARDIERRLRRA